ncbi:uncharacterized protein HD556DRAFT_1451241 [Suillus plorans]|uniref:F-box domain-containing protein n=1 Tax=Suillus plorans TaxID=116603 RepID=A0A9P7A9J8_9AGAM|nr:uncharacterized protein HD556DRAFT_1451241 [Suillus plorans]KAG1784929.1 hypothetical protein HD556DRAFT_1451241 [Suillus plorans]
MISSHVGRLSDDILLMIFKLVREEDQAALDDYLEKENAIIGRRWDDWGPGELDGLDELDALLQATRVCEHWHSLVSQTPSMWTVLEISFREGAAALEHARTFLQRSGSCLIQITILWDNPAWIVPVYENLVERSGGVLPPQSREEIMAGVHLGSVIQELHAHVHRWHEFTLRTTSIAHTYQALSLMSRPSVHPACGLEKLHLQFIHNSRHATHFIGEPSLFPGSAPPIRDLLLFGITWAWPSSSMLSSNLTNLRIHYDTHMNEYNSRAGPEAEMLSQLLGALINLRTLALEVNLQSFDTHTIKLPRLHSLAIKSRTIDCWGTEFLHNVQMPDLRILTLCVTAEQLDDSIEYFLDELVNLTDSEDPLELDELHLFNFAQYVDAGFLHRLYTQMSKVKTLTLGPGEDYNNLVLATALLPTSSRLQDLPLPGLQTLVVFDVPKQLIRCIVLERQSLAGPLEELYCSYPEGNETDDWQLQVKKFYRIGHLKSTHYTDPTA